MRAMQIRARNTATYRRFVRVLADDSAEPSGAMVAARSPCGFERRSPIGTALAADLYAARLERGGSRNLLSAAFNGYRASAREHARQTITGCHLSEPHARRRRGALLARRHADDRRLRASSR